MNNEKGSALLVALIACLIMSAIGTILIVSSMDGRKFANTTNVNMQAIRNGQTELNQIIQEFKVLMDAGDTLKTIVSGKKYTEYNAKLTNIEEELEKKHTPDPDKKEKNGLTLEDITGETIENGGLGTRNQQSFSRVLRFTLTRTVSAEGETIAPDKDGAISKKFTTDLMLSPTPSFLQFATGSEKKVYLRGGLEIKGDVYASDIAVISRFPYYYVSTAATAANPDPAAELKLAQSTFPLITGSLYLNNKIGIVGHGPMNTNGDSEQVFKTNFRETVPLAVNANEQVFDANGNLSKTGIQYSYNLDIFATNQYKNFFRSWDRNSGNGVLLPPYFEATQPTILMKQKHNYIGVNYPQMVENTYSEGTGKSLNASGTVTETDLQTAFQPVAHDLTNPVVTTGTPVIDLLLEGKFPNQPEVEVAANPTGDYSYNYDTRNARAQLRTYQNTQTSKYIIEADTNLGDIYDSAKFNAAKVIIMTDFINWPITKKENYTDPTATEDPAYTLPIDRDIHRSTYNRTFTIDEDINIGNKLLIVDGNLEILSDGKPIKITSTTGKIIVNGKLIIRGNDNGGQAETDNVEINATIYTNGFNYYKEIVDQGTGIESVEIIDTTKEENLLLGSNVVDIHDTKITKGQEQPMILLANGDVMVRKINEFSKAEGAIEDDRALEMFLYSTNHIELYGIASVINIKGGIFAREGLALNGIRQNNVTKAMLEVSHRPNGEIISYGGFDTVAQQTASDFPRLKVTHDANVLLADENSLPLAEGIQYIMRSTTIN